MSIRSSCFECTDRRSLAPGGGGGLARPLGHHFWDSGRAALRVVAALRGYVGDTSRVQGAIELAVRMVADIEARGDRARR
jgi:hypothetical protein